MGGEKEPAPPGTLLGVGPWGVRAQVGLQRALGQSVSILTTLQVQAVPRWLRLCVRVLDDLARASQPSAGARGGPSVDLASSPGCMTLGVELCLFTSRPEKILGYHRHPGTAFGPFPHMEEASLRRSSRVLGEFKGKGCF